MIQIPVHHLLQEHSKTVYRKSDSQIIIKFITIRDFVLNDFSTFTLEPSQVINVEQQSSNTWQDPISDPFY